MSQPRPSDAGPLLIGPVRLGEKARRPKRSAAAMAEREGTPSSAPPQALWLYKVLPGNESQLVSEALESRPWWRAARDDEEWNFWWGGNNQRLPWVVPGKATRVVSQWEHHAELCTKTRLALNLQAYAAAANLPCSWVPLTFVVTAGTRGRDLAAMRRAVQRLAPTEGSLWILKPSALNRGRGVVVVSGLPEIEAHLQGQKLGSQWVVQKYMESPLLVHGRKFDIRSYCLVTPEGAVLVYRHSYVRTSSQPFTLDTLSPGVHLTNDAIQRNVEGYSAFEEANKLTMAQLQEALGGQVDLEGAVVPQMRAAAKAAFSAAGPKLVPAPRPHSFELLGLDFMIDTAGRVVLIEINSAPALYRCCKLLSGLLPPLIEEVLQRCLDPCCPPPASAPPREPLGDFLPLLDAPRQSARRLSKLSSMGSTGSAATTWRA